MMTTKTANKPKEDEELEEEEEELETGSSLAESAWTTKSILPPSSTTSTTTSITSKTTSNKPNNNTSSSSSPHSKVTTLRTTLSADIITTPTITSPYTLTPLGSTPILPLPLPLVYCDQTASNRPLRSIESFLQTKCFPLYGNTHTNTSVTGSQSTAFVAEARQIVAEGVGASVTGKAARDVVLFAGSGTTSVVDLLIDCLNLRTLSSSTSSPHLRPLVFIGPYEHHSNLLPWRESGCEIVMIPPSPSGISLQVLETILKKYQGSKKRMKMATFSASSNVTGLVPDIEGITKLLHKYSTLSFWDYATAAPYLSPISISTKDAIFFSPHKMIGGINTPGVLVVKKELVNQVEAPFRKGGGGTVFYVTQQHHRFLSSRVERYEGGTPDIVGIWRVGLCFLVKRSLEMEYRNIVLDAAAKRGGEEKEERLPPTLVEYEYQTYQRIQKRLKKTAPNLILLGAATTTTNNNKKKANHLPIFSFLVKCSKRFLHYNYVCALLNDLFGIQSRGGCQCSGPYSQRLLGLTTTTITTSCCGNTKGQKEEEEEVEVPNEANAEIETALLNHKERSELLRPGYTRLSLPFKGLREEEVEYVVKAMEWVAKYGWMMMCLYRCNHRTGEWRHWSRQGKPLGRTERRWLSHYNNNNNTYTPLENKTPDNDNTTTSKQQQQQLSLKEQLDQTFQNANAVLQRTKSDPRFISEALKMNNEHGILGDGGGGGDNDEKNSSGGGGGEMLEKLRWYVYPQECARWLKSEDVGDVPPDTFGFEILGAIRPLGFGVEEKEEVEEEEKDGNEMEVEAENKDAMKKKEEQQEEEMKMVQDMDDVDGDNDDNNNKKKQKEQYSLPNKNELYSFRDGEHHSGQATTEEIEEGFNDGEISEQCQIYWFKEEEWIGVELFLKKLKGDDDEKVHGAKVEKKEEEQKDEVMMMSCCSKDNIKEEKKKSATTHSTTKGEKMGVTSATFSKPPPPKVVVESARAKKKPARDSSTWGRSACSATDFPTPQFDVGRKDEGVATSTTAMDEEDEDVEMNQNSTIATCSTPSKMAVSSCTTTSPSPSTAAKPPSPTNNNRITRKNGKRLKPPPKMMRYITQAMIQWNMVEENDRLLLGLSGGKDSLSLLHCLLEFQRKLPINFTIEVCTIDPMTPSFDPSPLIPYVESLGLKYHYIRDDIVSRANTAGKDGKVVSSLCSFCARMKRGNLYTCARENKCNKLVLAQHLDDCAESFLMSVMHNGFVRTMKAHYQINAGDIAVIRPLVYCRESLMTDFAKSANLPVINENCPACFEEPKERARVKKLLSREETLYPNLFDNLRRSLIPLMHDDATSIMRCYLEDTIAKSRKSETKKNKKKRKNNKHHNEAGRGGDNDDEEMAGEEQESTKDTTGQKSDVDSGTKDPNTNGDNKIEVSRGKILADASEEEIIAELARRRAEKYKLSGAMKRLGNNKKGEGDDDDEDPTGQVCTLNGGNGSIPCRELME